MRLRWPHPLLHRAIYFVRVFVPSWIVLRQLRARSVERLSRIAFVVCPVLATFVSLSEKLHLLPDQIVIVLRSAIPEEIFVAYLIAVSYALATLLFDVLCPNDIKINPGFSDYLKSIVDLQIVDSLATEPVEGTDVGDSLSDIQAYMDRIDPGAIMRRSEFVGIIDEFVRSNLTPEYSWIYLNRSRVMARILISTLFCVSIFITTVSIGWTVPKEVFKVHSFSETLRYLF